MTKYDTNDTMRIIGTQHTYAAITGDNPIGEDFRAVWDANLSEKEILSLAADFFTLGVMYGVKKERSRRTGKKITRLK